MIEEDFPNENYELRFASFNTNDQIFSDPLPISRKGKKFTLGPNFNNYLINGILECSANTVFESVYFFLRIMWTDLAMVEGLKIIQNV